MCGDKYFPTEKKIIAYCSYCGDPITEDEGFIYINGRYYHYDSKNKLKNCYFPEEYDE